MIMIQEVLQLMLVLCTSAGGEPFVQLIQNSSTKVRILLFIIQLMESQILLEIDNMNCSMDLDDDGQSVHTVNILWTRC